MKMLFSLLVILITATCHGNQIINIRDGLTLARIKYQKEFQVLAVTADDGMEITALNISELTGINGDIPVVFHKLGYDRIQQLVLEKKNTRRYRHLELLSPAGDAPHHIALGFNYADHAVEQDARQQPFLFVKNTIPTRLQKICTHSQALLDYEIEIGARPLKPVFPTAPSSDIPYGFFLCGDFTDRAILLRNMDVDDMQSGRGFSQAKSRAGFFPTGPYLVIPRDQACFLSQVSLKLHRNGNLKQDGTGSDMIWQMDAIVEKVFLAERAQTPTFSEVSRDWLPDGIISTQMTFLTGTPEGVIMQPPSLLYKIKSGFQFAVTGAFLKTSVTGYTIKNYIQDLIQERVFLQPGESVSMQGSYLGKMTLEICNSENP